MNERIRIITEQALALPASERERLYEALLISLQGGATEEDEAALGEEVRRRREAFKSGEMSARPFEDILQERLAK
jgi:putative addiction module component (TIGR02574 family)